RDIFRRLAGTLAALAGFAGACAEDAVIAVIDQRVDVAVGLEPDRASAAAVATIRAAVLNVFFPTKTQAAVTALAGVDLNDCFINEFHDCLPGLTTNAVPLIQQ